MNADGDFDYSSFTLTELRRELKQIDKDSRPRDFQNLAAAIVSKQDSGSTPTEAKSIYASLWQRLGAYLLDFLVLLPIIVLSVWGGEQSRHFLAFYFLPGIIFNLWFHAYLVKRYGGTPGKLLMGIKIVKVEGGPVGYQEAMLRYSVLFVLATLGQIAGLQGHIGMTDSEYFALDWQEKALRMQELAPSWFKSVTLLTNIWIWSEFVVMLTNKKRRAIHDFIAGTVVIRAKST